MSDSTPGSQFGTGIGEEELARLEAQGRMYAPAQPARSNATCPPGQALGLVLSDHSTL